MLLLGLDTGGTYTDAVLFDPADGGVRATAKALTTRHDLAVGLRGAVEAILPRATGEIGLVSLSTTLATNALVEGQGSPICLVLIGYDRGALDRADLGRAIGSDPIVFVGGGHTAVGEEQAPLDLESLERAARTHAARVAAFAVSGFFSVRNPAHEVAARDLIRKVTGLPVTCGHELSTRLDAPRRALTAALNARLVPQLEHLIRAVENLMAETGIRAPLMVVKGDGSLVAADVAHARPVETILSGPAASVVGAHYLAAESDVVIVDIGGTTTDIALLRDGRPVLDRDGATVGGWKTMVEALAVHTFGLGGDSEVRREGGTLALGPRRLVPLALLAQQHPATLDELRRQVEGERVEPGAGRFVLRRGGLETGAGSLTGTQVRVWEALVNGPVPLNRMAGYAAARAAERLVDRGLVALAGFTPSDAAHVLGLQRQWPTEAARLGAELWRREDAAAARPVDPDAETFCRRVTEAVIAQSGRAVLAAALAGTEGMETATADTLGRHLVDRALAPERPADGLLDVAIRLRRPLVAVGAPAGVYYPDVARRLGARLVVPPHADVCNAIGAVAGGVSQSAEALITAPAEGRFRVHLPDGNRDFEDLEGAAMHAVAAVRTLAAARAKEAGAGEIEVRHRRADQVHRDALGLEVFIESRIEATAFGRPRPAVTDGRSSGLPVEGKGPCS